MNDKDPFQYGLVVYALVIAVSAWGGIVSAFEKHKSGQVTLTIVFISIELISSGFTGLLGFWVAQYIGIDLLGSVIAAAVSGHLGPKSIVIVQRFTAAKLESLTGLKFGNGDKRD